MKLTGKRPRLEEPTKYRRPDGTTGTVRWTAAEQEQLRRLSPDGTAATATAMLHASLPPDLDGRGRLFTTAIRRAIAPTASPPHPDRSLPRQETIEELKETAEELEVQIIRSTWRQHDLLAAISRLVHPAA